MTTFFTSDTHFGHANIIKHCKRPFISPFEMDSVIIQRWNKVVKPADTVYHLGDFAVWYGDYDPHIPFRQLNGEKHLVFGNHDHEPVRKLGWVSVEQYLELPSTLDPNMRADKAFLPRLVLFHFPISSWHQKGKGAFHLHGHCHGGHPQTVGRRDVGVDCQNFTPISRQAISERIQNEDGLWLPSR